MESNVAKQSNLTHNALFNADVYDMNGGIHANQDVRPYIMRYQAFPDSNIELRIDNEEGMKTVFTVDNRLYDPSIMSFNKHPLSLSLGNKTVSSSNQHNRLWSGRFVVEYDLKQKDESGSYYLFMNNPSQIKKNTFNRENNETFQPSDDSSDYDDLMSLINDKVNMFNKDKGKIVPQSTLFSELVTLVNLYRQETSRYERTCFVDPILKKLLLPSAQANSPMFDVAFQTNITMSGLKVIFYPTVLTQRPESKAEHIGRLEMVLAIQTDLLIKNMPLIVAAVQESTTKTNVSSPVQYLVLDPKGCRNLSLPANTKPGDFSYPYHHLQVIENKIRISNEYLATTLGVVKTERLKEWLYYIHEFNSKMKFAARVSQGPANAIDSNEWKRRLLFHPIASKMPFRNRHEFVDFDYYISGLCCKVLTSGYGVSIDNNNSDRFKTRTDTLTQHETAAAVINNNEEEATSVVGDGRSSQQTPPPPWPLKNKSTDRIKKLYNEIIQHEHFQSHLSFIVDDSMGYLKDIDGCLSHVKDIFLMKKREDRNRLVEKFNKILYVIQYIDNVTESNIKLQVVGIVQMVFRYLKRDKGLIISNNQVIVSNMKFENLQLEKLWSVLLEEVNNPPTPESDALFTTRHTSDAEAAQHDILKTITCINDEQETEESLKTTNATSDSKTVTYCYTVLFVRRQHRNKKKCYPLHRCR